MKTTNGAREDMTEKDEFETERHMSLFHHSASWYTVLWGNGKGRRQHVRVSSRLAAVEWGWSHHLRGFSSRFTGSLDPPGPVRVWTEKVAATTGVTVFTPV